jgi:hypothetical protein
MARDVSHWHLLYAVFHRYCRLLVTRRIAAFARMLPAAFFVLRTQGHAKNSIGPARQNGHDPAILTRR